MLLELKITRKRHLKTIADIADRRAWDLDALPMRNAKSGLVALRVRQRDTLLDDGSSVRRYALVRRARTDHINEAALDESNWERVDDATFGALWSTEAIEAGNTLAEDTTYVATGLLLPVWRKISAKMLSVVRIASADGRAVLGRVVDAGDLGTLCQGMGIDTPTLTPTALIAAARGGARPTIHGLDTMTLKTSRVGGSQRLELTGALAQRLPGTRHKAATPRSSPTRRGCSCPMRLLRRSSWLSSTQPSNSWMSRPSTGAGVMTKQ